MDIATWLRGLGLERYEPAFRDNEIDASVLPELTAEDLRDIGVELVGHRRKLLAAIAALRAGAPPDPVATASGIERRRLTIIFCDLVGSTALSVRRDPEDLRDIIAAYHHAAAEVVERFEGFVARYMGDGIMIYFGYPSAHEDDAERAARCALAIIDAVSALKLAEQLQARIGIGTGMVVVGGNAPEHDVVGETPNLAARLQSLAEPNTVLIDENTRRLIGRLFEYRELGAVEARGFSGMVSAWQVLRPSTVASRFEALRAAAPMPLVGRREELELLLRRWRRARTGEGQVVLLSGEPGIGKSRMTAALAERLRDEPHDHLRYFCAPLHQGTALYPVITHLEHAAGFTRDDPPAAKLGKLRQLFGQGRFGHLRRRVAAHATQRSRNSEQETELSLLAVAGVRQALIAELLSLPIAGAISEMNLSPQRKKERTLEALLGLLEDLSRKRPVLMVFEDVHWIDPTSRELLDLTIERIRLLPVLLIMTFRPEFQEAWSGTAHVSTLLLNRLDAGEGAVLAKAVAGKPLPDAVVSHITTRADGIPLFLEELTRTVVESGLLRDEGDHYALDRPMPAFAIPPSLHASLLARLDRLGPAPKEIAQIGAAIGRDFSYELLAAVAQRDEAELRDTLGRLTDAGLVFQRGVPPDATFSFKHALVRNAAYSTLLRGPRRALHASIGHALELRFPNLAKAQPQTLAHHFTEAGLFEAAIDYWHRAGGRSIRRSEVVEAAEHLRRGIELIALLPAGPQRELKEFRMCLMLAQATWAVQGHGSEALDLFLRAQRLVGNDTSLEEHIAVLHGLWRIHLHRGQLSAAREFAEQSLAAAARRTHPETSGQAHRAVGTTLFWMGNLIEARSHLERALEIYALDRGNPSPDSFFRAGNALATLGVTLWPLGYPDQAFAAVTQALADARSAGHSVGIGITLWVASLLEAGFGACSPSAAVYVDEAVTHCHEHLKTYEPWVRFNQGILSLRRGQFRGGLEMMQAAMKGGQKFNADRCYPLRLGFLATAHAMLGQPATGIRLLDEAILASEETQERVFEAELYRLRGDLLLQLGMAAEAEVALIKALSIARGQAARMWELRAAISLARLWRDQGRAAEAPDLLAPAYGWFTEGFNTPDLKDAKALLDELG